MNVPHNERSPGEDVMGQKGQREKLPESVIETIYREITRDNRATAGGVERDRPLFINSLFVS